MLTRRVTRAHAHARRLPPPSENSTRCRCRRTRTCDIPATSKAFKTLVDRLRQFCTSASILGLKRGVAAFPYVARAPARARTCLMDARCSTHEPPAHVQQVRQSQHRDHDAVSQQDSNVRHPPRQSIETSEPASAAFVVISGASIGCLPKLNAANQRALPACLHARTETANH